MKSDSIPILLGKYLNCEGHLIFNLILFYYILLINLFTSSASL